MSPAKVVLIGPESTGKTWLAGELAVRYGVPWAEEHARAYVERHGAELTYADVDPIGRGQKAEEDGAIARAERGRAPFVLLDTDLVSTAVYSRHYYGDCPPWIEEEAGRRVGDLYLLHHTDVEWVADGHQRAAPERREELFARFESALRALRARVSPVRGSWEERRRLAVGAIDALLAAPPRSRGATLSAGGRTMDERTRAELVREIRDFLDAAWPRAAGQGDAAITERRLQLAAAVLMVSVVRADLESRQDEHRALGGALARALDLGEEEGTLVVRAAEEALDKGVPFAGVLARLARECTLPQKRLLVESLWRVAYADAELAGHEEYLVRKIAGQLDLSTADLVETKVKAREAFLREDL